MGVCQRLLEPGDPRPRPDPGHTNLSRILMLRLGTGPASGSSRYCLPALTGEPHDRHLVPSTPPPRLAERPQRGHPGRRAVARLLPTQPRRPPPRPDRLGACHQRRPRHLAARAGRLPAYPRRPGRCRLLVGGVPAGPRPARRRLLRGPGPIRAVNGLPAVGQSGPARLGRSDRRRPDPRPGDDHARPVPARISRPTPGNPGRRTTRRPGSSTAVRPR